MIERRNLRVLPYKGGSESAKALSKTLGCLRLKVPTTFRPRLRHTIINWGNYASRLQAQFINDPASVAVARDKLQSFIRLKAASVPIPEYTTSQDEARAWLQRTDVVERHTLTGQGGAGIRIRDRGSNTCDPAPLYTKYFKRRSEYRVHVMNGEVLDVQEKKLKNGARDESNREQYRVRNLANGWVYCRGGVRPPDCVTAAAVACCNALGLDFGAVDIAYNEKNNSAVVFEVNTAPGLVGTTLQKYVDGFRRHFGVR